MSSNGQTITTVLDKLRKSYPDREAYITYNEAMERKAITFAELWTLSSRFAHILKQEGLKKNDIVVVSVLMSLEYVVICFGVILAGGSVCSMEKFFDKSLMLFQTLTMCEARLCVVNGHEEDPVWMSLAPNTKINENNKYVRPYSNTDVPTLKTILLCYRNANTRESDLLDRLRAATEEYVDIQIKPTDGGIVPVSLNPENVARPKLCEMSHGAIVSQSMGWAQAFSGISKSCLPYPWYLVGALPFDTLNGWTRVMPDLWNPLKDILPFDLNMKIVEAEAVSVAFSIPPELIHILEKRKDLQGNYVDVLVTGGMPITRAIYQSVQRISKKTHIVYLSSEAAFVGVKTISHTDEFTPFNAGQPIRNTEIRVLNDNLEEVPPGETGQIAVRSPSLFTRYVGEPEKTRQAFTQGGWYLSKDAGYIRSDGDLIVHGRSGDIISRGIINVIPSWLESPISQHPDVMEVTVVPIPDALDVQNTCACVVKRSESNLTAEDIFELVQKSLTKDGNALFALDYVLFFDKALPRLTRVKLGEVATERLGLGERKS